MTTFGPRLVTPPAFLPSSFRRWFVLVAIVSNVLFNYVAEVFLPGESIRAVSARYATAFSPAPYTFSIWGLIYGSFLVYAVVQLWPSRRHAPVYDALAYPLAVANILASLWIGLFRLQLIGAALVTMLAMLTLAGHMFWTVQMVVEKREATRFLSAPFALFFGWLMIAAFANLAAYGVFTGGEGSPAASPQAAVVFMIVAVVAAGFIARRARDAVLSAAVAWAALGIAVAHSELTGTASLIAAICTTFSIFTLYLGRKSIRSPLVPRSRVFPEHRRRLESYV